MEYTEYKALLDRASKDDQKVAFFNVTTNKIEGSAEVPVFTTVRGHYAKCGLRRIPVWAVEDLADTELTEVLKDFIYVRFI